MENFNFKNVSFTYPKQENKALRNISFSVNQGEFLIICGPSGCGKSTLLKHLKSCFTPYGSLTGEILFNGKPLCNTDERTQAQSIGFVLQSAENQIITDKVWHELAFGLESLGYDTPTIRRRVAEIAAFFGIEDWFYKDVTELSGGQKQLLNLASVMAMNPKILVLDEPTSQLDPIAASEFLALLGKINRELGITVILTEHRLEEAFPYATQIIVMENGKILCDNLPQKVGNSLKEMNNGMFLAMPAAMRVWAGIESNLECPLSVREGSDFLCEIAKNKELLPLNSVPTHTCTEEIALQCKDLWFRYEKTAPDVIKSFSLTLKKGEFYAMLGGNGAGKTTVLKTISGICSPYCGSINTKGKIGMLPQNPQTLFVKKTVREDLLEVLGYKKMPKAEAEERITRIIDLCRLNGFIDKHPYDISGGEQQRAALAKVLLTSPDILLLDEPTKGFDAEFKIIFADIIKRLTAQGVTVLMVSHDVNFCAEYAHKCGMFFDGNIVASGTPREFFSGNSFYTTPANRMARNIIPNAVTVNDIIYSFGGNIIKNNTEFISNNHLPKPSYKSAAITKTKAPANKQKLNKRTITAILCILLLIPITIIFGSFCFDNKHYNLIALLVLFECMLPFVFAFEGRKPKPRELVTIAVLCAIGIAGRGLFFMIPQFKPILALTVISGVGFGAEAGFLVGSLTMLASNMLFSQGPWTPWQMFAMGIIGFLAGVLFKKGRLRRTRITLSAFGAFSAIIIYAGIMNPAAAFITASETINLKVLTAYYIAGLPMDLIHAVGTVVFLMLAAKPLLEKIDRIKEKYGLIE
ncbi:MAG: ATP-binding cassette domain-containing protein [Clostridia bacterium]|nr:ATP-binding cassette domain-containing protein [Clostridia bacterium]